MYSNINSKSFAFRHKYSMKESVIQCRVDNDFKADWFIIESKSAFTTAYFHQIEFCWEYLKATLMCSALRSRFAEMVINTVVPKCVQIQFYPNLL